MSIASKIVDWTQAQELVESWRRDGQRIVFTNGCFDILHQGHVMYLEQAKELGHRLVLGLNSDASTKRLKGEDRPINAQDSRAVVMAALESVDLVVVFGEDTPADLIELVRPDILVKGGDYQEHAVVGGEFVKSLGGRVEILPFVDGFSTTSIAEKIRHPRKG